jgi:hypothetical protein
MRFFSLLVVSDKMYYTAIREISDAILFYLHRTFTKQNIPVMSAVVIKVIKCAMHVMCAASTS